MKENSYQFNFKELGLKVSHVENIIGFNEGDEREYVISLIEEILEESGKIMNIKAQYRLFNNVRFDNAKKTVFINDLKFNLEKIVFAQLKKSESVILFLCTAGEEIGNRSKTAMKERDLLKGFIYDVIGSEAVEAAADLMQNDLEKFAVSAGKKITNRYSPGYCGWYVGEQHKLFQLMPDNFCGIKLTQSALMDPIKSISGIIGFGENVKSNPYTCHMCDMKDCIYKRTREKKI